MCFLFREGRECKCYELNPRDPIITNHYKRGFHWSELQTPTTRDCTIKWNVNKQNCANYPCKRGFFPCGVKNAGEDTCVSDEVRCDSKNDCGNWADEKTTRKEDCTILDRAGVTINSINSGTRIYIVRDFTTKTRGKVYFSFHFFFISSNF